jgi:uncharacterized damage-inducible protein DinB
VPEEERLSVERPLALWRQERAWTLELVAAFPESAFDWRPAPDAFSCGELVVHMIQSEKFWRRLLAEAAEDREYDPFGLEGTVRERYAKFREPNLVSTRAARQPRSFAACLELWPQEQAKTEAAFASFTHEQLAGAIVRHPIAGLVAPLFDMIWFMTSHDVHHRGQLSAYAKMLRIAQPPLYIGSSGSFA